MHTLLKQLSLLSGLPLIFHIGNALFQDFMAQTLVSHCLESSAAQNKICLIFQIYIGYYDSTPFLSTKGCILASYLQKIKTIFPKNNNCEFIRK